MKASGKSSGKRKLLVSAMKRQKSFRDVYHVRQSGEPADELRQKLQHAVARQKARVEERTVRARAKRIWEENGRPEGRDEEFWLQAERETRGDADG
jgi:hypothetical protein